MNGPFLTVHFCTNLVRTLSGTGSGSWSSASSPGPGALPAIARRPHQRAENVSPMRWSPLSLAAALRTPSRLRLVAGPSAQRAPSLSVRAPPSVTPIPANGVTTPGRAHAVAEFRVETPPHLELAVRGELVRIAQTPEPLGGAARIAPGGGEREREPLARGAGVDTDGARGAPLLVAARLVGDQRAHRALDGDAWAGVAETPANLDAGAGLRVASVLANAQLERGGQRALAHEHERPRALDPLCQHD